MPDELVLLSTLYQGDTVLFAVQEQLFFYLVPWETEISVYEKYFCCFSKWTKKMRLKLHLITVGLERTLHVYSKTRKPRATPNAH